MRLNIRIIVLLFVVANTSFAQGSLDFTYGKNTERLGVNYWQNNYLGNSVSLEYTHPLGQRLSVSTGLIYAGWLLSAEKNSMVNGNSGRYIGFCTGMKCAFGGDCIAVLGLDYHRYSTKRLELPIMVSYRIGKHASLPFAVRAGMVGVANQFFTHDGTSDAIQAKAYKLRTQFNLGFQIPIFRASNMGFYLEPFGRLGYEVVDPNRLTRDLPNPNLLLDYGLKLGMRLY